MRISIEGIDGAGKTTIAKKLAKSLNYDYSGQKALSDYMEIETIQYLDYCHNYRKNVKTNVDSMFFLYSLSCYLSLNKDNVICDRHLPTVFFWYSSKNNLLLSETIYKISKSPDITFILDVSVDMALANIERKAQKSEISKKELLRDKEKAKKADLFVPAVTKFLEHFNLNYVVINANNKTIEEIHNEILEIITSI